jgi:hypothetical protein
MKKTILSLALIATLAGCTYPPEKDVPPNTLSYRERRAGWQLLFDGQTGAGWTSPGKETFPAKGWEVKDGTIHKLERVRGGDLLSLKRYSEFDLIWDWKIAPKGNNGIKYFVTPERNGVGHEYQMLDDVTEREGQDNGKHSTASFYDVLPPFPNKVAALRPAGEWNTSRVYVRGNKVEHWLNGQKVYEYILGSPEVKAAVQKSKFKNVPHFGERVKGHLLLTDHNDETWFRSIKIIDYSQD